MIFLVKNMRFWGVKSKKFAKIVIFFQKNLLI